MSEINIDVTIDQPITQVDLNVVDTSPEVEVVISEFSPLHVLKTGDTMTGNLVFDDASIDGVGHITFDTTHEDEAEDVGSIYWNSIDGTLNLQLTATEKAEMFQNEMFYGKAVDTIAKGDLVQFAGVQGDHILIKKAVAAEVIANPEYFLGVAKSNLVNAQFGYAVWFGKTEGVQTTGWVAGDLLYFDNATGGLTKVKPSGNQLLIIVGAVIKESTGNSSNGVLIVRPQVKINGKSYQASGITLNAGVPTVITHNMNLQNRNSFTINVMNSSNQSITTTVTSIDVNSLSIESAQTLTGVHVTILGI